MDIIKIMLVDDHQMIRDGIKASLAGTAEIAVVAEAASVKECMEKLETQTDIDVVVMDISLGEGGDGIAATRQITEHHQGMHVLAMSMHDAEAHVLNMLKAGAIGYMLKDQGMGELVEAIKTVARGESFFCKPVSDTLMNQFTRRKNMAAGKKQPELSQLTKREIEILKMIAEEYTNQEIADKLFISSRTVDTHRRNLILKLNVKNTAGLVRYAMSQHLIDLE